MPPYKVKPEDIDSYLDESPASFKVSPDEIESFLDETPTTSTQWARDDKGARPSSSSGTAQDVMGIASQSDKGAYIGKEQIANVVTPVPALAFAQTQKGVGGLLRQAGEVVGSRGLAKTGEELRTEADLVSEQIKKEHPLRGTVAEDLRSGLSSFYQNAPFMAAGGIVGAASKAAGIATGLAPMGALTEGDAYAKYREKGFGVGTATVGGLAEGGIEVGTELLPFAKMIDIASPVAQKGFRDVAKNLIEYAGSDYAGEALATLGQDLTEKVMANPNSTNEDRQRFVEQYFTPNQDGKVEAWENFKSTMISTTPMVMLGGGAAALASKRSSVANQGGDALDQAAAGAGSFDYSQRRTPAATDARALNQPTAPEALTPEVLPPARQQELLSAANPLLQLPAPAAPQPATKFGGRSPGVTQGPSVIEAGGVFPMRSPTSVDLRSTVDEVQTGQEPPDRRALEKRKANMEKTGVLTDKASPKRKQEYQAIVAQIEAIDQGETSDLSRVQPGRSEAQAPVSPLRGESKEEVVNVPALTLGQVSTALEGSGFTPEQRVAVTSHLKDVEDYGNELLAKAGKSPQPTAFTKADIQAAIDAVVTNPQQETNYAPEIETADVREAVTNAVKTDDAGTQGKGLQVDTIPPAAIKPSGGVTNKEITDGLQKMPGQPSQRAVPAEVGVTPQITPQTANEGKEVRQPWEMNREEWTAAERKAYTLPGTKGGNPAELKRLRYGGAINHKAVVEKAVAEGLDVPANVLAEYNLTAPQPIAPVAETVVTKGGSQAAKVKELLAYGPKRKPFTAFTVPIDTMKGYVFVDEGKKIHTVKPDGTSALTLPHTDSKLRDYQKQGKTVEYVPDVEEKLAVETVKELAASTPRPEAVATPEEEPAKVSPPSPKEEKKREKVEAKKGIIEDTGEKLGGARKDKQPSLSVEYSEEEYANLPLSKIWPKEEVDAIENTFMAAVATAGRAEIPTKPKTSYKLTQWVNRIKAVRGMVKRISEGDLASPEKLRSELAAWKVLRGFYAKVQLLENIPREQWHRIGKVEENPDAYSYNGKDKSGNYIKIASPHATVEVDGRTARYNTGSMADHYDAVNELLGTETVAKKMKFEVRGRPGFYFINKVGDPLYRHLQEFTDSKEALAFARDRQNYNYLVQQWEAVKDSDNVKEKDLRRSENRPRTGADHRKGKDVDAESFRFTFGFRGVEFGNWVNQGKANKERQGMINAAYDALMDMANILNLPPKALSLNGTLGLGFGSRGSGWASAHYESSTLVINLTKTRGAGALAHELFHALDNYFSLKRGKATFTGDQNAYREGSYITHKPEAMYVHKSGSSPLTKTRLEEYRKQNPTSSRFKEENWIIDPKHPQGVRPEVENRFADLVTALDDSPMNKRSRMIDKGKSDGYWSRTLERAARAFENYIIYKMQQKGYSNDYLANVVAVDEFQRDVGRYPYLLDNEIAPVAEAFDNLFSTIQTKETPQGVALFSTPDFSTKGTAPGLLRGIASRARLAGGWKVEVVATPADLPANVQAEMERQGISQVEGVKDGDSRTVFLVANGLSSMKRAKQVLAHETFHVGIIESELRGYLKSLPAGKVAQFKRQNPAYNSADDLTIANEMLAQEAETNLWIKRIIGKVNDWLKSIGIDLKIDKADVYSMIDRAMTRATQGESKRESVDFSSGGLGRELKTMVDDLKGSPYNKDVQPIELSGGLNENDGTDVSGLREATQRRDAQRQLFEAVSYGNTASELGEKAIALAGKIQAGEVDKAEALTAFAQYVNRVALTTPGGMNILRDVRSHLGELGHNIPNSGKEAMAGLFKGIGAEWQGFNRPLFSTQEGKQKFSVRSSINERMDDPKWKDLAERFVYSWINTNDPRKRVYAAADKKTAKNDMVTAEELRGKKTAAEVALFREKVVEPMLKELAEAKLTVSDLEEYGHALHAPERNQRMREVNAKRTLDRFLQHMTEGESQGWKEKTSDFVASRPEGVSFKEMQNHYLDLIDELAMNISEREEKIMDRQDAFDKRTFTAEEKKNGTPERVQKSIDKASSDLEATKSLMAKWEDESPRLSGMTDEEADSIVTKWEADPRNKSLKSAKAKLDKINRSGLDALRDSGELSDEEYEGIINGYDHYVPLMRDGFSEARPTTGRITGPTGKPLKVAMGSMREVVNIVAHSVQNYQTAVNRKHKAEAGRALYQFALDNPDSGITVEKLAKKPTHDQEGNIVMYPDQMEPENGVFVKVDGEKHLLEFDTDERTPQGRTLKRFLESIKDSNANIGPILSTLTKFNRYLAAVNTMVSPEFILSNFVRDFQTAFIHLSDEKIKSDKGFRTKIGKDIFPAIRGIFAAENGNDSSPMSKDYREFAKEGGKIGWMQGYDKIENLAKELEHSMKLYGDGHITLKKLEALKKLIASSNTAVENGVRLATYRNLRDSLIANGKSPELARKEAANVASKLTVDFTQKGKYGPAFNSLYLFANAGIQGNVRMIQAVATSKAVQKIVGGIVVGGIALQLLALSGGDDDTGEPYILGLPDFVRERNIIIMLPGTKGRYISIPMPYGYNGFNNIGAELATVLYMGAKGKDYNAAHGAMRVVTTFANSFNPLASGTLMQSLSPTITDPIVMTQENKDYAGRNLMPAQNMFGTPKPDSERYWKGVSPTSKFVTALVNRATGGDKYEGGMVDVSPETLDMLYDTVTGSAGRFVSNMVNLPYRAVTGELEVNKMPGIRRFTGQWDDRAITEKYYEAVKKGDIAKQRFDGAETFGEKMKIRNSPEFKNYQFSKGYEGQIGKLRKILKMAEARNDTEQVKKIREQILTMQKKYLAAVNN